MGLVDGGGWVGGRRAEVSGMAGGAPPGASGYTGDESSPRPGGGGLPFQPCQLIKSPEGGKVPAPPSGSPQAGLAQHLE